MQKCAKSVQKVCKMWAKNVQKVFKKCAKSRRKIQIGQKKYPQQPKKVQLETRGFHAYFFAVDHPLM